MTDIEIKTRSIYDQLSPAEQKVAWYFLQNLGSVFDDPIAVLAEKSGVSQVMWVRFCKALGFSGLCWAERTTVSSRRGFSSSSYSIVTCAFPSGLNPWITPVFRAAVRALVRRWAKTTGRGIICGVSEQA